LNFLYGRYDKFADLEREVEEGLKGVTGDTSIGEADDKYEDLKKALKLIRVTVKASERMGNLMDSINAQISQIIETSLGLTKEEVEIIRSALCDKGFKVLAHKEKVECEENEKGLNHSISRIYWDIHNKIFDLVDKIDGKCASAKITV
jgi:chemotaxis regulatin CheY-phosphate phosphatase CheZ